MGNETFQEFCRRIKDVVIAGAEGKIIEGRFHGE